jgi:hypothetical protein
MNAAIPRCKHVNRIHQLLRWCRRPRDLDAYTQAMVDVVCCTYEKSSRGKNTFGIHPMSQSGKAQFTTSTSPRASRDNCSTSPFHCYTTSWLPRQHPPISPMPYPLKATARLNVLVQPSHPPVPAPTSPKPTTTTLPLRQPNDARPAAPIPTPSSNVPHQLLCQKRMTTPFRSPPMASAALQLHPLTTNTRLEMKRKRNACGATVTSAARSTTTIW